MLNRLTFSLASLTLIFALVFIAMPVMAAPGGPTVSITEYSGKDDYTTTATQPDHVQERTDFRLKVEFSIPVDGWDATDITVSGAASLTSSLTPYTSDVTVIPATDAHAGGAADVGKVYYVAINITTSDGNYEHSVISASIAADAVNGNIPTNRLGNEAKTQNFTSLPGATRYSITAKIDPADKVTLVASGDDKGKLTAADTFNVLFEYSGATGAYPTEIPTAQIQIKDKDGKDIANATTGVTATTAGSIASGNVSTAGLTVGAANVAAPIQVGVNPNWAGSASTFVWIPMAPGAPDPTITTQPTAEIVISLYHATTRIFRIDVTFTPGEDSNGDPVDVTPGADFHTAVIKGTDSGDNAVSFTREDSQMSKNSYTGLLKYNLLSRPPLTIKLLSPYGTDTTPVYYKDTSHPADDATGTVGPTATPVSFASGASIPDQTYTVDTAIAPLPLPAAMTGTGTTPLTYTLTPSVPGLTFNRLTRTLRGTPTTEMAVTEMTYKVTDSATPATNDTLTFNITVNAEGGVPAKPAAPTAATNATNDLSIDVSWTAPADNGSTITGYTVKQYNSGGTLVKTFPDDDPNTNVITGTSYTVGPVPAADRGKSFTFTVTATNANGTSPESDMSAVYTVGAPSTGNLDVNRDGRVDVLDLVLVAVFYGTRMNGLAADVNADGIVNVQDFAAVAAGVDAANALGLQAIEEVLLAAIAQAGDLEKAAEAPMRFNTPPEALSLSIAYENVTEAFIETRRVAVTDVRLAETVALLETLLVLLTEIGVIPQTTALLPNYPNPFNPETWLPYQLSTPAEVTLSIYSIDGRLVRTLDVGHQPAGGYRSKHRAAYWDGKNQLGEHVASGLYFYTLTAGDFTATRKMLIAK